MPLYYAKNPQDFIDRHKSQGYSSIDSAAQNFYCVSEDTYKRFLGKKNKDTKGVSKESAKKIYKAFGYPQKEFDKHIGHTYNKSEKNYINLLNKAFNQNGNLNQHSIFIAGDRSPDDTYIYPGLEEYKDKYSIKSDINPQQGEQKTIETLDVFIKDHLLGSDNGEGKARIAIVGEAGSGKTTLLSQIGKELIERNREYLVIWISLKEIKNGNKVGDYLLNEWLAHTLSKSKDLVSLEEKQQISNSIKENNTWILLDGLDEYNIDNFCKERDLIEKWIESANIIITCRTHVWQSHPRGGYKAYRILEFENYREYINKYFGKKSDLADRLEKPENNYLKDLVKNPLLLAMTCCTYQKDGKLPDTKYAIYKKYLLKLLEIKGLDEYSAELYEFLGLLSRETIEKNDSSQITDKYIVRACYRGFLKGFKDRYKQLLNTADNAGWIQKVKDDDEWKYQFFHKTFQEYFAASYIDDWDFFLPRDHDNNNPRPVEGKPYRVFDDKWQEVIKFWMGKYQSSNKEEKNNFIENLVNFNDGSGSISLYGKKSIKLGVYFAHDFNDCDLHNHVCEEDIEFDSDDTILESLILNQIALCIVDFCLEGEMNNYLFDYFQSLYDVDGYEYYDDIHHNILRLTANYFESEVDKNTQNKYFLKLKEHFLYILKELLNDDWKSIFNHYYELNSHLKYDYSFFVSKIKNVSLVDFDKIIKKLNTKKCCSIEPQRHFLFYFMRTIFLSYSENYNSSKFSLLNLAQIISELEHRSIVSSIRNYIWDDFVKYETQQYIKKEKEKQHINTKTFHCPIQKKKYFGVYLEIFKYLDFVPEFETVESLFNGYEHCFNIQDIKCQSVLRKLNNLREKIEPYFLKRAGFKNHTKDTLDLIIEFADSSELIERSIAHHIAIKNVSTSNIVFAQLCVSAIANKFKSSEYIYSTDTLIFILDLCINCLEYPEFYDAWNSSLEVPLRNEEDNCALSKQVEIPQSNKKDFEK